MVAVAQVVAGPVAADVPAAVGVVVAAVHAGGACYACLLGDFSVVCAAEEDVVPFAGPVAAVEPTVVGLAVAAAVTFVGAEVAVVVPAAVFCSAAVVVS